MRINMSDYRRAPAYDSKLFRVREHNVEVSNMNEILAAIEKLRSDILRSNEEIVRSLFEIQREQLNVRREIVSIQRDEMNLKADAIKTMKEITKNDDLDFLKQIDAIDNDYLDKSIERAKKIQELHNEAIFSSGAR